MESNVETQNIQTLKPCPFCGGEAEFVRTGTSRRSCIITCTECGCTLETNENGEFCGSQWNNRETDKETYLTGYQDALHGDEPLYEIPY